MSIAGSYRQTRVSSAILLFVLRTELNEPSMKRPASTPCQGKSQRLNQSTTIDENQRDLALVRKIARGDEQALEQFYRIFEPRVYAFALSRLNNPHTSGDILTEVMWAVWRGAKGFEGRATVTTCCLR